ncbi:penicillin-insensitive murein endopeptidase [Pseudoroseicyclus tamaricis]|uniref:Penicillin-insensitive murein endopeptidase n=1 Tax=Pseudoroseicyclus tamaricis TaxID=2705421 RepID=A0A6B2JNN4_9RHOB|nr:penicillin-insensitive murein endopeptidase [Pseudoroseicyclus tamaricis]NDU99647.1 penicillin-insensitive murein endopeptidase [Pseudoroseicyclus tamaricis]
MVRPILIALALISGLAACRGTEPVATQADTSALDASIASDSRVAKDVFGFLPTASAGGSAPLGFYSRGCAAGNVQLAETGPTWQAMRLSRNRNWGQPELVDFVQDLSRFAASQPGWEGLYVGDMSQPRGGPMLTGHASHQVGLDADIWMLPPDRLNLTSTERENLSSIRTDRNSGAYVNDAWTPQHTAILRAAASDPRVARIFVFPGAKVEMCNTATGDRSWLNKVRPWYGHNYHFHVRLNCPAGATYCEDQAPPPPGDGCADAQTWVNNIINPPPPDPDYVAPPSSGPVRMSDLPGACLAVAGSE